MNKKIKFYLIIVFGFCLLLVFTPVWAADWNFSIIPQNSACLTNQPTTEGCGLNEMVGVMITIAQIIFAVTGSLTLLMFAYGGTMFILAAGNQERISKAKQILTSAVVGLAIILGAWLIVNFVVVALTGQGLNETGTIFGNYWNRPPTK